MGMKLYILKTRWDWFYLFSAFSFWSVNAYHELKFISTFPPWWYTSTCINFRSQWYALLPLRCSQSIDDISYYTGKASRGDCQTISPFIQSDIRCEIFLLRDYSNVLFEMCLMQYLAAPYTNARIGSLGYVTITYCNVFPLFSRNLCQIFIMPCRFDINKYSHVIRNDV